MQIEITHPQQKFIICNTGDCSYPNTELCCSGYTNSAVNGCICPDCHSVKARELFPRIDWDNFIPQYGDI